MYVLGDETADRKNIELKPPKTRDLVFLTIWRMMMKANSVRYLVAAEEAAW